MNATTRQFVEGPIRQGANERVPYTLTTTPWGSSPSAPATVIKDATGTDVSATYITGVTSASGDVITTGTVHSIPAGFIGRLEIKFTISGNTLEAWADLYGEA
jgi:hypothetical protein